MLHPLFSFADPPLHIYFNSHLVRGDARQHALYFPATNASGIAIHPQSMIVALHGLQSHAEWVEVSGFGEELAQQGIAVFVIDRPGSGLSEIVPGDADAGFPHRGDAHKPEEFLTNLRDGSARFQEIIRVAFPGEPLPPMHLFAPSFGSKIAIPYLFRNLGKHEFVSLILESPAIFNTPEAIYTRRQRLSIALSFPWTLHNSPLKDEMFTDDEEFRKYIAGDKMAVRKVTRRFLLNVALPLTDEMLEHMLDIALPLLVFASEKDLAVDGDQLRTAFFEPYPVARKSFVTLPASCKHVLEMSPAKGEMIQRIGDWTRSIK